MATKFYSSKSNCKRALKAVNIEAEAMFDRFCVQNGEGGWGFDAEEVAAWFAPFVPQPQANDFIKYRDELVCPCCASEDVFVGQVTKRGDLIDEEYISACHACGWYADRRKAAKASKATGTGLRIEKGRPEQNGIKRPSSGGLCAEVWDHCDSVYSVGAVPKISDVLAVLDHLNENNVRIEFYKWRKFHGITGRATKKGEGECISD